MKKGSVFSDFSKEWLFSRQPQVKKSTFNKYNNLLEKYINPELGDSPPEEITCGEIERLCSRLLTEGGINKNGLSNKTVADSLSVVRQVLNYVSRHYSMTICNAGNVRIKQTRHEMRIFSRQEQEKLCEFLTSDLDKFNTGILLCLFTGLRIGEICGLCWEDVSIAERTLKIRQTAQRVQNTDAQGSKTQIIFSSPKSAGSMRTIPIPDSLLPIIKKHKKAENGFFLTNSSKKFVEPRLMQFHFHKVLKECGIASANFHALRHTFATRCIELGMDVKSLSEILGHSSITITMDRYVHPSMDIKRENMNKLSELL